MGGERCVKQATGMKILTPLELRMPNSDFRRLQTLFLAKTVGKTLEYTEDRNTFKKLHLHLIFSQYKAISAKRETALWSSLLVCCY